MNKNLLVDRRRVSLLKVPNIFDSSDFPEEWAFGIIVILFKDGMKSELNNYRGITLLKKNISWCS